MASQYDYVVTGGPSVFLVCPETETSAAWLQEVTEDNSEAQFLGHNLAVEHRYIADFVAALQEAGYTVGRGF